MSLLRAFCESRPSLRRRESTRINVFLTYHRSFPLALLDHFDQLAQDGDLQLEFDTIHHSLECRLYHIQVLELDAKESNIEDDERNIDSKQFDHELSSIVAPVVQELANLPEVDSANAYFLQ